MENEDSHRELVPITASAPPVCSNRNSRILSNITHDLLLRVKSQESIRFRIGNHLFREPDYRQVLYWSEKLAIEKEVFVQRLANCHKDVGVEGNLEPIGFSVIDGAIRSLVWDFDQLGSIPRQWEDSLLLETLALIGLQFRPSSQLGSLKRLTCSKIDGDLDLSKVPNLKELNCGSNEIKELDLSHVHQMTNLQCSENQITEIKISQIPNLSELRCWMNRLAELDLSKASKLTKLDCWCNKIEKLDFSRVKNLVELNCWGNKIKELDLFSAHKLKILKCDKSTKLINPPPALELHRF